MFRIFVVGLIIASGQTSMTFNIPGGKETFIFDSAKIRPAEMRKFARLSPEISATPQGFVGFSLEDCLKKDSRYRSCGKVKPSGPAFRHNAQVNLNHNLQLLRTLTTTKYPEALSPVVTYLRENLEFFQWRQTQRLRFARDMNSRALKENFRGFNAATQCASVIAKIDQVASKTKKQELVLTEWGDCVNSYVRRRYGEYPIDAWKRFLALYDIKDDVRMYE